MLAPGLWFGPVGWQACRCCACRWSNVRFPLAPSHLALQAASAPDVEISALLTCNSISPAEEGGALYVCVPSACGEMDGHDWADEVGWLLLFCKLMILRLLLQACPLDPEWCRHCSSLP